MVCQPFIYSGVCRWTDVIWQCGVGITATMDERVFHRITGTSVRLLAHCSRHGRQRVSCWLMNPQLQLYTNCFEAASRPDPIRLDPIGNRKSLPVFVSRPQSARCSPSWTFESNRIRWDPIVLVYVSESWGSSDSCDGTDRLSLW